MRDRIAFVLCRIGETSASLWGTSGSVEAHFGPPGASLGHPGRALELLWGCLGIILCLIEKKCPPGHPSQADGSQVPRLRTKIDQLELACRSRRSCRSCRFRRNGPRTAVQDLPSTRARDQDDVSFTNSLKLCRCVLWIQFLTAGAFL